jgi:hypothetical protein
MTVSPATTQGFLFAEPPRPAQPRVRRDLRPPRAEAERSRLWRGNAASRAMGWEVVAHLDDPAARDCAPLEGAEQDPVRIVLACRGELVADSAKPIAGPC